MSNPTIKVSNTADLRTALEAGYTKDQIEVVQQDNTAALATARAEGAQEGRAAATEENKASLDAARKEERARILALQALAEPGFEAELKAAIETGQTEAEFALAQTKAAKERGITIGAMKKDSPTGAPHAAPGTAKASNGWDQVTARLGGGKKAA